MSSLGQFFTTSSILRDKVKSFILNLPTLILEPSVGEGHLIFPEYKYETFEIDGSLKFKPTKVCDFLLEPINKTFETIIGNPPYVKKQSSNLYLDFINKCIDLLSNNGELIFIVPTDFLKLTSSQQVLEKMVKQGSFTHIFHPNNERLFIGCTIDVIVFRYQKGVFSNTLFNDVEKILFISNGIVTFKDKDDINNKVLISDLFDVFVGLVSAKEDVFKQLFGNVEILSGINKKEKYIFLKQFPCDNANINNHLLKNKDVLLSRKIRKFTNKNWFEFGAIRNISVMEGPKRECIYMLNLTRNSVVAFKGETGYFGGNLLMMLPKKEQNLNKIVDVLNSQDFRQHYLQSGRFKIGQKQLCNALI